MKDASELIALADDELLAYCRDDASRWAGAFVAIKEAQGWGSNDIDNDLMICWFANAIEGAAAYRTAGSERAGVDRAKLAEWADDFEAAAHEVPRGIKSTILMTRAQEVLAALATPPEQPAPAGGEASTCGTKRCADLGCFGYCNNSDVAPSNHGAVREALDDMLGAFAEGVCWSSEQRAAYEKAALALQNSDLHSPKIATSPGDVVAMKEACKRAALSERNDCLSAVASIMEHRTGSDTQSGNERFYRGGAASAEAILSAIDRLDVRAEAKSQEPVAVAVAVKPLEWDKHPDDDEWYSIDEGNYQISDYLVYRSPSSETSWCLKVRGYLLDEDFSSPEEAKAAVQADYEQRIKSALIPTTKPEAPAVSVDAIAGLITDNLELDWHGREAAQKTRGAVNKLATAIAALIDGER